MLRTIFVARPAFQARRAADDFGAGEHANGYVGVVGHMFGGDAGEEDGARSALSRTLQRTMHVRRRAAGGDAEHDVAVAYGAFIHGGLRRSQGRLRRVRRCA